MVTNNSKKVHLYLTGDTHGDMYRIHEAIAKIPKKIYDSGKAYLIIAGDFGFIWSNDSYFKDSLDEMSEMSIKILFIDGNHENFDMLASFPISYWNGGKVRTIRPNIMHLMRGQVYDIEGVRIFTFGGGDSVDKHLRREGTSYWKEEMPDSSEMEEGLSNLARVDNKVDYIITHVSPNFYLRKIAFLLGFAPTTDYLTDYLEKISLSINYDKWYMGHYHTDERLDERHFVLYYDVIKLRRVGV